MSGLGYFISCMIGIGVLYVLMPLEPSALPGLILLAFGIAGLLEL